MIEHTFERITFTTCKLLGKQVKLINESENTQSISLTPVVLNDIYYNISPIKHTPTDILFQKYPFLKKYTEHHNAVLHIINGMINDISLLQDFNPTEY